MSTRTQIAAAFHVDRTIIDAIIDGELPAPELVVGWPNHSGSRVLRTKDDLVEYRQCKQVEMKR